MKKFSKLFWVALVVAAVLACTAIGVFAAETTSNAVIYGESGEVAENFSVDFKFKENNTKVECGKITLTWDLSKMTAMSINAADALDGAQFGSKIDEEGGKAVIAWAGSNIQATEQTGTLFTVNFKNEGIADGGYAAIEVAVDNFGYTEGFVANELKSTVKANKAYASSGELYYNDDEETDTPEEVLGAAIGAGTDMTVILQKNMEFIENAEFGSALQTPTEHTITIVSPVEEGEPLYSLVVKNGVTVTLNGNFVFKNVDMYAEKDADGEEWSGLADTGFCFPENASGTFGDNITTTTGDNIRGVNLIGNVTVNSGTYNSIYGNGGADDVVITINGGTFNANVHGGSRIDGENKHSGTVTMTINGGTFNKSVFGGSLIASAKGEHTGTVNMTINDGKFVGAVYGGSSVAVSGAEHSGTSNVTIVKGTFTTVYGGSYLIGEHSGKTIITIGDGTFSGSLFCGSLIAGAKGNHSGAVEATINKGAFTGIVYGGSSVTVSGAKHSGKTEAVINGGTYTANVHGGSYLSKSGTEHAGESIITISGGTFKSSIYGGSPISVANTKHTGKSTLKFKGVDGQTITALTKDKTYIAGGSRLYYGSAVNDGTHEADSELVFENIYTQSYGGKTKNFNIGEDLVNDTHTRYVIGGSDLSKEGKHIGNSSLTIKNSIMTDIPALAGGSYINRNGNVVSHQGNSSLTIDAENGFGYLQNIYYGVFAGSFVNSYSGGTGNQTGTSTLYIKAPATGSSSTLTGTSASSTLVTKFTGKELAIDCKLYGGNYYTTNNTLTQLNDSAAEITGSCVILTRKAWNDGSFVFGGSYYTAKARTFNKITNKIIIDTCIWPCDAFAGYYWASTGKAQTTDVDLGIIYKNGGRVVSTYNAYITPMASVIGFLTNNGDILFEIHTGDKQITDLSVKWSVGWNSTVGGKTCIKLIEDGSGSFNGTVKTNKKADYLDISHVSNDVNVKMTSGTEDGYTNKINYRIADKNVYFAIEGTELPAEGAALAGNKQVEVNPTMTFDALINSPVIIYSSQDNTAHNLLADYSLYTQFDSISECPNGFVFYAADEDGNVTGEALTQIPADPSQKVIVKTGASYSAPTYLRHVFRMSGANLLLQSDFSIIVKFNATLKDIYKEITLVGTDKNGDETVISVNTENEDGSCSFVYKNVAAHTLGDDIQFKLRAKFGEEVVETAVTPYSVKRYCDRQLSLLDTKTALSTLLVDILNYGASAQKYMYPDTEVVLVNATLTEAQKAFGTEISVLDGVKSVFSQDAFDEATVKWTGATLIPEEKIKIRAKIRPNDMSIDPTTLKVGVVVGGGEMKYIDGSSFELMPAIEGEGYYVYFDDLEPNQLRDTIDLTVYDLADNQLSRTAHYSVESYVFTKKNDSNEALVNLCDEMLQYGDAHYAYVEYLKQNGLL